MIYLVDEISKSIDSGDCVLGLYLDFTKAFDTVNHDILLRKLEHYGIRDIALRWLASYLDRREQFVEFNNVASERAFIRCGVPQGSILGPLLFLLYINDLPNVSSLLFGLLFADDSNMFMSGRSPDELIRKTNLEINKILKWLQINKLTLNIKKTHFMIFRSTRKKLSITEKLLINGQEIELVQFTKFLGIYIDSRLTWGKHIDYIKGKVARSIGILCKARKYLNKTTLMTLYYSFVYPCLSYCAEVWGNTYNSYLDPLFRLQKKSIRIITNSPKFCRTTELFKQCDVLSLRNIYLLSIQMFMYKYYQGILPNIFRAFFALNSTVHSYNTRQLQTYHAPIARLSQTTKFIRYVGVKTHAIFCPDVSYCCSYHCYKKEIRKRLLSHDIVLY